MYKSGATCKPPVPDDELDDYMRIAERHYVDVVGPANIRL